MRIKTTSLLLGLLLCTSAAAQTTTVSLNVTDAASQVWFNGTWAVRLSATGTSSNPPWYIAGSSPLVPVPNQNQSGNLDGSGNATITLTPNASILPFGTIWVFTVCPLASSHCYVQNVTAVGSSQTLNMVPPANVVSLTPSPTWYSAYNASEVVNYVYGSTYFNLTNACPYVNGAISGTANWISMCGTGGGGSCPGDTASPNQVLYNLAGNCAGIPASVVDSTSGAVSLGPTTGAGFNDLTLIADNLGDYPFAINSLSGYGMFDSVTDNKLGFGTDAADFIYNEDDQAGAGLDAYGLQVTGSLFGSNDDSDSIFGISLETQFQGFGTPDEVANLFVTEYNTTATGSGPAQTVSGLHIGDMDFHANSASGVNAGILIDDQTYGAGSFLNTVFAIKTGQGPVDFGDILSAGILTLSQATTRVGIYGGSGWQFNCSNCDTPTSQGATCTASGDHAGAYGIVIEGVIACFGANIGGPGGGTVTSVHITSTGGTLAPTGTCTITSTGTCNLDLITTGVSPGSYTNTNLTVDAYGRITAASNGSGSGGGSMTWPTGAAGVTCYSGSSSWCPSYNASNQIPAAWVVAQIALQANGTPLSSQSIDNLINSTMDSLGIHATVSNPSGGQRKIELTGTGGEPQNLFLATPNGVTGSLALRAIVGGDIPASLPSTTSVNGTPIPHNAAIPTEIAHGSSALNTASIAPGACETTVTTTATGAAVGDNIIADFGVSPRTVAGYNPIGTNVVTFTKYVTTNAVNFDVCSSPNNSASITPGAMTIYWIVVAP